MGNAHKARSGDRGDGRRSIRTLREALSRVAGRVIGSRFAKPIARAAVATAGLFLLAFIGRTAVAGAMGSAAPVASASVTPATPAPPAVEAVAPAAPVAAAAAAVVTTRASHTQATPDDPVFLNTATVDDLRRLPGIGDKRANAIVALRSRLGGRFRAIEDLLKVKGIGHKSLNRLRPLVRLDPPPPGDGGTEATHTGIPP